MVPTRSMCISDYFDCLRLIFSHIFALFIVYMKSFACLVVSSFLKKKRRGSRSGGYGKLGGARTNGEIENCVWNMLYERRFYFQ